MENRFRFRVWDKGKKEYCDRNFFMTPNGELGFLIKDSSPHWRIFQNTDWCIIEQCTGLKDKNGTLIYEGDVVLINKKLKQVYFFNGAFFCKDIKQYEFNGADPAPLHYWIANEYDIEIICNVHEIK